MPFRVSPFRFSDIVFCVLRRFKPEEVLVTLRAFLCPKTALRTFWKECKSTTCISLRSMRFMDWVHGKGDVLKVLLFHFVPKKLEQTFPAFSRCSSPIWKILFHFSKQNWNRRNPHILGAFLRLFHLFHFFINLYLREKKKEKSVYIKKFFEKNWNNWNNGVSGREPSGNQRSILPEKTGTKVEQNWNIYLRAPLFPLYCDFFA